MKRLSIIMSVVVLGLSAGCATHYRDTSLFDRTGRSKPLVAVLPVINSTCSSLGWDLSSELTSQLASHVTDSPSLYLVNESAGLTLANRLNTANIEELSNIQVESLAPAEFAIVTELVDHKEVPYGLKKKETLSKKPHLKQTGATLAIAMRVRVLDLRGKAPKVVLQEVVKKDHDIARAYMKADYEKTPWGSVAFENTPMGIAHHNLVKEIVGHVEGYIGSR